MPSKADVIEAAAALADRIGFENIGLSAVAESLGIRTPSLYNHVQGLPGLRKDLMRLGLKRLAADLSRATIGRERDNAVREFARVYRSFARTHPGLYAAILQRIDPDIDSDAGEVLEIVVAVLAGYRLDQERTLHMVRGFRSALHGFVALETAGQFAMPLDIEKSFDMLIETLIAGLHSSP